MEFVILLRNSNVPTNKVMEEANENKVIANRIAVKKASKEILRETKGEL